MNIQALQIVRNILTSNLGRNATKLVLKKIDESVTMNESIEAHKKYVRNWSDEVNFNDLKTAKKVSKVYVHLDTYVSPLSFRYNKQEQLDRIPLLRILNNNNRHLLLSGQPGSGKTTSLKFICQKILNSENSEYSFPLLIRVRDLNKQYEMHSNDVNRHISNLLFREIESAIGIKDLKSILLQINKIVLEDESIKDEVLEKEYKNKLLAILEKMKPLILIDGIDEVL